MPRGWRRGVCFGLMVSQEPRAVWGRELRAKALVSSLEGAVKDGSFTGEEYADYQRLLDLLPSLRDPRLIEEIKALAEKVNALLGSDEEEDDPRLSR